MKPKMLVRLYKAVLVSRVAYASMVSVTRSRLVGECNEALGRLEGCNRLRLLWVPGHTGIRGNEIASLGARSEIVGPEPFVGIARC